MIIVGEKINTSRSQIAQAVENRDKAFIVEAARVQREAGADFIDVNAGTFVEKETEALCWLVETIQSELEVPLCLDSPSATALTEALKLHKGEPMINSITLEEDRFEAMMPIVTGRPCHVVALCMSRTSMPRTVEERVAVGSELIEHLTSKGVPAEKIYVDPLVQPVSVDTGMGPAILGAVREICMRYPRCKTVCGLSNISFGLPHRSLINRNFLALAMHSGLSAAILDPTDRALMSTLRSVDMLMGRDDYCERYIDAYQEGVLVT